MLQNVTFNWATLKHQCEKRAKEQLAAIVTTPTGNGNMLLKAKHHNSNTNNNFNNNNNVKTLNDWSGHQKAKPWVQERDKKSHSNGKECINFI